LQFEFGEVLGGGYQPGSSEREFAALYFFLIVFLRHLHPCQPLPQPDEKCHSV
jgi:hypothetical protein